LASIFIVVAVVIVPLVTIGSIGDYAVSACSLQNEIWYKNNNNTWVQLGSDAWKFSWPTIQGAGTPT